MIKALRMTLSGGIPHERVTIYSHYLDNGYTPAPNLFEDAQLVFTCKSGKFVVPDYAVILIQMHNKTRVTPPEGAVRVKRIILSEDLNFPDAYIIPQHCYGKYGVPQIFREYEQMTFLTKDGLYITTDFQVQLIQLWENK